MKKVSKNPIAAMIQPIGGKQLPSDWQQQASAFGGTYDRRNFSEMEPKWSVRQTSGTNLAQAARLTRPTWEQLYGTK